MSEFAPKPDAPKKTRPSRSRAQRAERRRVLLERDTTIFNALASGLSVAEIALSLGFSPRRTRALIGSILERRQVPPLAAFVPLQLARLGDAMVVAHDKMMGGDLKALDRVIRITRELERYHGYAAQAAKLGPGESAPGLAPQALPRALPAPPIGEEPAPERAPKTRIAPATH